MSKKLQLSISEPCHENWEGMTPDEKGRFCGACQKQVVDFTHMSDRQIAEFFKRPSTSSVCGRFMTDQLDRDIEVPRKRMPWLKYFLTMALPAFFISKLSAQHKMGLLVAKPGPVKDTTKVTVVHKTRLLGEVAPNITEPGKKPLLDTNQVTGQVVNERGEAIPFASIQTGKPGKGMMTDENGRFTIPSEWLKKGSLLTFSSVGYADRVIKAGDEEYLAGVMQVQLTSGILLPEVVLTSNLNTIVCTRTMGAVTMITGETITRLTDTATTEPETKPLPMPETQLLIYPNPVSSGGSVNLSFKKPEEGYYQLQLVSLSGQLMQQKEIWIDAEASLLNLEIPSVAAGTYFIVLANRKTGKKFSEKIIIQ